MDEWDKRLMETINSLTESKKQVAAEEDKKELAEKTVKQGFWSRLFKRNENR